MRCPHCGTSGAQKVRETRPGKDGRILRRRHCERCGQYFQTAEQISELVLRVQKADGRIVPFNRDAVRNGIRKAAVRPRRLDRLDAIVEAVVADAYRRANNGVIASQDIASIVLEQLRTLDPVSHVRYALVHIGRRDRPARPGWQDAEEARDWLIDNYPNLQHFRAPVRLTEVVKREGTREPFDPEKLAASIRVAAKGRGIREEDLETLADQVVGDVQAELGSQPLVTSGQLAAEILRSLRGRDDIAYLRFASTAKGYLSPEDYEAEAVSLRRAQRRSGS